MSDSKSNSIKDKISEKDLKALRKIKEYKKICESNIVSILWKNPELYYSYDDINIKDFIHNDWKVYFQIGKDIMCNENKSSLDDITVNLYLEKHPKLKEKYIEYGGFETMNLAKEYVKEENIDGYIAESEKWNTVIGLIKNNFPVADRLKEYVDMKTEDIYEEYEAILNHVFLNSSGEDKVYEIDYEIDNFIDELDDGLAVGLPLYNSPILTHETGGNLQGNITLCGGLSGVGKTALTRTLLVPSIIENNEIIVCMLNEESIKKWQRELLIWVANNIFKEDIQKHKLRDGKFTPEFKTFLKSKCANWIKGHKKNIKIIPFKKYSTSKAIKYIKKYSSLGVKYFILDTFKADANTSNTDSFWFNMQQSMVNIQDIIKEEAKNVHIWVTFQLSKSSAKQRFYTQDNIGLAKNMVDVASTALMIRKVFDDELDGGKHELKVFKEAGKSGKTKVPVKLEKNKNYQIIFIVKNREGSTNDYQIVVEHDLSRNIYNEVGICVVPVDF